MYVFLRTVQRIELPDVVRTEIQDGRFVCLDADGNVLREFARGAVLMFSPEPLEYLTEALERASYEISGDFQSPPSAPTA